MLRPPKRPVIRGLSHYEVQDAANTIARAREHLANPKMVAAIQDHIKGLSAATTGALRPKKLRP